MSNWKKKIPRMRQGTRIMRNKAGNAFRAKAFFLLMLSLTLTTVGKANNRSSFTLHFTPMPGQQLLLSETQSHVFFHWLLHFSHQIRYMWPHKQSGTKKHLTPIECLCLCLAVACLPLSPALALSLSLSLSLSLPLPLSLSPPATNAPFGKNETI